jgi:tRNA-specific 2-thiouridylase
MDLKNKRDDDPHGVRETRSKKVVIGLSGGINSMVAACLLKLQKFELVAVTVTFDWQDYGDSIDQLLSCHVNSSHLDQIRQFCHKLGIPHIVLNATDEFREAVTERWVGSRLTGTKLNACWNCHDLRIKLIFDNLAPLDADVLATGHMAKLFKSDLSGTVSVHTSSDVLYDDSLHVARLPNAILDKMILPLSDLQHKEILKLAQNFGISSSSKKIEPHSCFPETFHYENFFWEIMKGF